MGISRYWVAHNSQDFSSTYWSISSGGPTGASVPDSSCHAYFDHLGPGNCTCSQPVSVLGLTVDPGFPGRITQQNNPITIGLEDASFAGGKFVGGTSEINVLGNFYLTGTDFTSTRGNLIVQKDFYCNDGSSFASNDGTVTSYANDKNFDPHGATFSNLVLARSSLTADHQVLDSTCFIKNKLILDGGYLQFGSDGTMYAMRDVECNEGFGRLSPEHNGIISFYGPNKQALHCNGGVLPHVFVNKNYVKNPVIAYGDSSILINGDFLIFDGTFNTNGLNLYQGSIVNLSKTPVHADFTWSVVHEIPRLIQFIDLSTGAPLDWNWDLGDGTQSFIQSFVHNYPGFETVYPVTLRVINDLGPDTTTINVMTYPKYTNFYADNTEVTTYYRRPVNFITTSTHGLYTSHDGSSWVLRYRDLDTNIHKVCKNTDAGVYLAGTSGIGKPLLWSANGYDWGAIELLIGDYTRSTSVNQPVYGNGLFLINDNNNIYRSGNGIDWNLSEYFSTQLYTDHPDLTNGVSLTDVVFGNRTFVLLDELNNTTWTTPDGVAFTRGLYVPTQQQANLSFGRGLFVIGGFHSSPDYLIWISSDGSSWAGHFYQSGLTADTPMNVQNIVYGNDTSGIGIDTFLAQYYVHSNYTWFDSTTKIYTIGSSDASTWYVRSANPLEFSEISFYKGPVNSSKFIGVGTDDGTVNNVFTTVDGVNWVKQQLRLPTSNYLYGVWADSNRVDDRPSFVKEEFVINSNDLLNGGVTLKYRAIGPVSVSIVDGASQKQGYDFECYEAFVTWTGFAMQGIIGVGDTIVVVYCGSVVTL